MTRLTRRGRLVLVGAACLLALWLGAATADVCFVGDGWGSCAAVDGR